MALTRASITDAAMAILTEFGLGDLSMRRLARDLGVQPSALYWHVKNKQDVFVLLAERMADEVDRRVDRGVEQQARADRPERHGAVFDGLVTLREVLLQYRDGAEIYSAAYAFAGSQVVPTAVGAGTTIEAGQSVGVGCLDVLLGYVLGFTALEQNRTLLATGSTRVADSQLPVQGQSQAFMDGLSRLLSGCGQAHSQH